MSILRRPAAPHQDPRTLMILRFMDQRGLTSYNRDISELQATFEELQAEAGPNGRYCEVVQGQLDRIDHEIWAIADAATERYDDWASGPLP